MHYLTTKEAAQIIGCGTKNITLLCKAGKFPGAKKMPGKKTAEWRIPAKDVANYQAQKDSPVEVMPPEALELVTKQSFMDFITEIQRRNEEEIAEIRRSIEEIERRKDEKVAEVRSQLSRKEEEIAEIKARLAEVEEKTKKKPGILARLFNRI